MKYIIKPASKYLPHRKAWNMLFRRLYNGMLPKDHESIDGVEIFDNDLDKAMNDIYKPRWAKKSYWITTLLILIGLFLSQNADAKPRWCGKHVCHTEVKHVPIPPPRPELDSVKRPEIATDLSGPSHPNPFSGAGRIAVDMQKDPDFTTNHGPVPYITPWQNSMGLDHWDMIRWTAQAQMEENDPGKVVLRNLQRQEARNTLRRLHDEFLPKNVKPSSTSWDWSTLKMPFSQFLILLGAIIAASGLLYWFDHRKLVEVHVDRNKST